MAQSSNDKRCNDDCPIKHTLSMFQGKYSALILRELLSGTKRFSVLLKKIPGISSKTLNEKLKQYTQYGVITRHAYPEIPPKVEYCITEKGKQLEQVIIELHKFGLDQVNQKSTQAKSRRRMSDFDTEAKGAKRFGRRAVDIKARAAKKIGRRNSDIDISNLYSNE
ncbi:winged helix-turn-helix transcriptional regulator [Catenovulum maritimum]|uniref:winged helix-turn-helix transcriptional regulator n=1 Tax=Catenovulum maritimum TaxID=1513271 RepID=UPI00097BFBE7|nr:helix-turn-helix domain-containing protein [Catenovulum maritimum]